MNTLLNFRIVPALAACGLLAVGTPALASDVGEPGFIEEAREETRNIVEEVSAYSVEQKDEALSAAEKGIASLEENIEEIGQYLDTKGDRISAETREEYRATLNELRERRDTLQEQYRDLATASEDNWESAKSAFTDALRSVQKAWSEMVAEIRQEVRETI